MPTERIDIQVRERGTRTVRRRLEGLAEPATAATRALRLLQNALFVLGGAGVVAGLTRVVDSLTSFENRLRIVTRSTNELNAVQAELFRLGQETRAGFTSVAETYARTALSVRFLGLSQREVLDFTESLTQAAILSGASIRETNAALVQLGQGLASNRLSGDELRSVLEQLPFVADVIARQLNTTRGGLRALAKEGQVTTQVILDAFTAAADEIQDAFDSIQPTIGQALEVLSTSFLRVLDVIDDTSTASQAVANAIISIARAADIVAAALATIAVGLAALGARRIFSGIASGFASFRRAAIDVAAIDQTLVNFDRSRAQAAIQNATASKANAQATITQIQAERALHAQRLAGLTTARVRLSTTITEAGHRRTLAGHVVTQARAERLLARNQRETLRIQRALSASNAQLTAAIGTRTAATNALEAAQIREASAAKAATATSGRLARAFPLLTHTLGQIRTSIAAIFGLLFSNPLTAFLTLITATASALFFLGDRFVFLETELFGFRDTFIQTFEGLGDFVEVPITNVTVTFKDLFVAALQLIAEEVVALGRLIGRTLGSALDSLGIDFGSIFDDLARGARGAVALVKGSVNIILSLFIGTYRSIVRLWDTLPEVFHDIMLRTANTVIRALEFIVRTSLNAYRDVLSFIGANDLAEEFNPDRFDFSQFYFAVGDSGARAALIFSEEFSRALGQDHVGNAFERAYEAILNRAIQNAAQRAVDLEERGEPRVDTEFRDYLRNLLRESELLGLTAEQRVVSNAVIEAERKLKRELTDQQKGLVGATAVLADALAAEQQVLDDIRGPLDRYNREHAALERLLAKGLITLDEFTMKKGELDDALKDTSAIEGFRSAFRDLLTDVSNFGETSANFLKDAYEGVRETLADLVVDGEIGFANLRQAIQKQLVELAIDKTFQALIQLIAARSPGFANFAGLGGRTASTNVGLGVVGLQTGGSFVVPGAGAPDSRLVRFAATPGERVTVETPAQQRARPQIIINVNNNYGPDAQVEVETRRGPRGEEVIDVMVDRSLASGARSGRIDPFMRSYGTRRQLVNRG